MKEAVERFRQALERDPDNVDSLANLGVAYMRQGNAPEAVQVLRSEPSSGAPTILASTAIWRRPWALQAARTRPLPK